MFLIIIRILELQSLQCKNGEVAVLQSKLDEMIKEKSDLQKVVDKQLEEIKKEKDKFTAGIQKTLKRVQIQWGSPSVVAERSKALSQIQM